MTGIMITGFPSSAISFTAVNTEDAKDETKFTHGYHPSQYGADILTNGLISFFSSLIVHDDIYLSHSDYLTVLQKIGAGDMLKLLDRKIVKVIFDRTGHVIEHGKKHSLTSLTPTDDAIEEISEKIQKLPLVSKGDKSLLLQYSENAKIEPSKGIVDIVTNEINRDIKRGIFSDIGITTSDPEDVQPKDMLQLLRIADITHNLILLNDLSIDSMVQDGFVKQYLHTKLGVIAEGVNKDGVALFSNIHSIKGIPDLYTLYRHGSITMDDILSCRETFSGGLFRKWYASTEYDEKQVLKALVNKPTKETGLIKFARFVYPNVLGLIGPITGAVISAADSYIVGRLIEGWSPSVFLDDVYKRKIDQRVAAHEADGIKKQMLERFGKIGRNDPCPCQSGKKFKNCHGNNL